MGIGAGLCMYDVVVKKFMFAISSPDEFLGFCASAVDITFAIFVILILSQMSKHIINW